MGGLNRRELLRPFFIMAFLITCSLFLNFEYLTPKSLVYLQHFENQYFRRKKPKKYITPSAYALAIDNGGKLLFSTYDAQTNSFHDVYYIKTHDDIWKMKHLYIQEGSSQGHYIDHLVRDENNQLVKENSYTTYFFPELLIDFSFKKKGDLPFEHRSLSSLYSMMQYSTPLYQGHTSKVQTQFFFKMLMPFASFLVVIACAPFCIIFSRKLPIFMIYAMSVFGIITFFTLMDAAVILGEHHLFPPLLTIATPFVLSFAGFGLKFIKTYSQ
jgi:lipopolysaccharide export system permease protein